MFLNKFHNRNIVTGQVSNLTTIYDANGRSWTKLDEETNWLINFFKDQKLSHDFFIDQFGPLVHFNFSFDQLC